PANGAFRFGRHGPSLSVLGYGKRYGKTGPGDFAGSAACELSSHFRDGLLFAVAPIGDTEMLTRALGPRAGLVTHRRACPRHLTATPRTEGPHEPATTHRSDRIHWMD